ncbi:B27a [Murid betaherpesvirus 8]|uniref:B27a n=3 Tax=Rat cytomegalovirus (isolate England) TaxID=1261657 RepID=K7Y9Z1_RCMVE|nr:E27a [Murid betaherpesvirus 8]AKE44204.1 a27 [Rat cytomegalovirus ALL-03]AFX83349.1 E27a [Murid betaherpesvirus 8]AKB93229.1 B27a [Murid betaherpesvirus 8]WEG71821.1 protein UL27 [Murid betaherpesvirus 8]WPH24944.1 B27a [Murid betaherpesvirus 8]
MDLRDRQCESDRNEDNGETERQAIKERPNAMKIVFELIKDETADPFCRKFILDNLVQLKDIEQAARFGFAIEPGSEDYNRGVRSFIRLKEPYNHVELKMSYLKNARFATANGAYGIRGLTPAWDSAIWGLLREVEAVPYSNPFTFPTCERLEGILNRLEYRPEATDACRTLCRATVAVQYAISILYGYDRSASVPRYLRRLIDEYIDLQDRIRRLGIVPVLKISGKDMNIVQNVLPERVCAQIGIPFTYEACLLDEYYDCIESNIEQMYDLLCMCKECGMRRMERFERVRYNTIGERYPKKKRDRERFFEENYVIIHSHPDLGVLKLPKIRHLNPLQQLMMCRYLSKDLLYDTQFGPSNAFSRAQGVPLPFSAVQETDMNIAYALYLASNSYFMCFLLRCVRDVLRHEEEAFRKLILRLVNEAVEIIRDDVNSRVWAGADSPVFVCVDPRESGISAEERDLAIARSLEELTFSNELVEGSHFGGFCRDAARFLDLIDAFHFPKALREHRAREDLLLHTFKIEKMYDNRPLSAYYGDRLVPYHVLMGGHRRRDGAVVRTGGVNLTDNEIVRGHWRADDMMNARLRYFDSIDSIEMIRNVSIRQETLMFDLDRMYISRSELESLESDVESDNESEVLAGGACALPDRQSSSEVDSMCD